MSDLPAQPDQPFDAPWQARAFALAVVTVQEQGLPWDAFRDGLKAAVAADPGRAYWESWLVALERLTAEVTEVTGDDGLAAGP